MGTTRLAKMLHVLAAVAIATATAATAAARSPPPPERADRGALRVLVFVGGSPAGGAEVTVAGRSERTEEHGSVVFEVPPGSYATRIAVPRDLVPEAPKGAGPVVVTTRPLQIVEGEVVEAIVTLGARGELETLDVEAAGAGAATGRARAEAFERRLENGPRGTLRGRIVTQETSAPVAGARVFVRGAPVEAVSDGGGAFELELPEGAHDLVVIHSEYATENLEDVEVSADGPDQLTVAIAKAAPELDELVVSAPHIEGGVASLVAARRDSASVDDVIGAAEMSRSGDSDAAGALGRVTGITVVGGEYVYVRGMGERYSSALLNGQAIPSPEPERRVIPLDLFSTDVLQSVVIQKTPSPDIPAEFGGGVVQLRTRAFPEELTASLSMSAGAVTTATLRERPAYDGGRLDLLGIDDGSRALPEPIREGSPLRESNRFEDGYTPEELAGFGRMLSSSYDVHDETVPVDAGFGASLGSSFAVGGVPAGVLVSGSYDSDHGYSETRYKRFVASSASEGGLALNNDFLIRSLDRTVSTTAILAAGARPGEGHEIRATTLLLRITDDETTISTGRSDDLGAQIRRTRLRFLESQLLSQQLAGTHDLGGAAGTLEWRLALSRADRSEPDRREYLYADESSQFDDSAPDFQLSTRPFGNRRVWSDLVDDMQNVGLDYSHPIPLRGGLDAEVKLGAAARFRGRAFNTLRLTLKAPSTLSAEDRRQAPEQIWSEDNITANDGWILEDTTQPTDAYSAKQRIQAGYAMATVPVTETLEVTAGARVERSRQQVATFSPFSEEQAPAVTELDDTDVLPSATTTWRLADGWVFRSGYGRTLNRPDFRELSESQYRDVVTARRFVGNPELERATIDNYDARLEHYFSNDEVASVGVFYKSFDSPIEQVDRGGVDRSITWQNADSARNVGIELQARRRLGFVADPIDPLFAAFNVAVIRSHVDLGDDAGVSTSTQRPLQGQSPYVINAQLGYDDPSGSGITAVLLYNVFGRRIRDVGRLGAPDIYEEPFHRLDAVYTHELGEGLTLKLKARNLLDPDVRFVQGGKVARRYRRGRSFGASVTWSY